MRTELIPGSAAFDQLAGEWDALARRSMTDTPFQTLAYQKSWWTHLGPGNLWTVAVRSDDDLAAIGCFYVVDGLVHFNGCVEETDYLDLITPAASAETAWRAVLDVIMSDAFPAWHALELCNIPAESPTREILTGLSAEYGLTFSTEQQEVCPIITLPETFDAYLAGLDKKQRHEIRRKLRRARGAEAELIITDETRDLRADVDTFLDLLQKSTAEKSDWLNDERRAVFHETAAAAQANDTLQLMLLQVEGQPAAALFNFDYNGRVWVYNSGLDPDAFGYLSSGVVLTARAIERAIDQGRREFDFLRGNETYKYRFGATDTEIFRIRMGR